MTSTTAQTYCANLHYTDEARTYKCQIFNLYTTHKLPCICKAIFQYGQTWHQLTHCKNTGCQYVNLLYVSQVSTHKVANFLC